MNEIIIHPRIHEKHPEIDKQDVRYAFQNIVAQALRVEKDVQEYIAIGSDSRGRFLELVYRIDYEGNAIIFHAFTPPTKKALKELGLDKRR